MKKIIQASVRRNRGIRLNYDAVETVCDLLEDAANNLNYYPEINIDINDFKNSSGDGFIVKAEASDGYVVTTPDGYTVEVDDSYRKYKLIDPAVFPSEYGDIRSENIIIYDSYVHDTLLVLEVPSSNYDDAELDFNPDDFDSLLRRGIDEYLASLDNQINQSYESMLAYKKSEFEEAVAKEARRKDKQLSKPITRNNLNKVITALKKESDSKFRSSGNYLRKISYEDDFVSYYDLNEMIRGLNEDDVTIGDALADPGTILDYGELGSKGMHHAADEYDYEQYKKEMNSKYGFTR